MHLYTSKNVDTMLPISDRGLVPADIWQEKMWKFVHLQCPAESAHPRVADPPRRRPRRALQPIFAEARPILRQRDHDVCCGATETTHRHQHHHQEATEALSCLGLPPCQQTCGCARRSPAPYSVAVKPATERALGRSFLPPGRPPSGPFPLLPCTSDGPLPRRRLSPTKLKRR